MDKKNKFNVIKFYKIIPMIILIISMCMGVGYASVNSVVMNYDGEAQIKKPKGMYIIDAKYKSNVNANINNSKVISAFQTNLKSKVILSSTDNKSSITYEINMYNSSEEALRFDSVKYIAGSDTYSNLDITFTLNGLKENQIVYSKNYITFTITFSYLDSILATSNSLTSYLNFNFVDIDIWNLGGVNGTVSLDMDAKMVQGYKNLTESNFFFEPTSIPVESVNKGDMYFTKIYNPSTGIFTYTRTTLEEVSPIEVNGNVYAVSKPVQLLTTKSGDYTLTIDCKSVPDYQNKTENDFLIDLKQVYFPSTCYGTMYFSKTYNPSTGVLTLKRTSIKGQGLIKWYVDIYYVVK